MGETGVNLNEDPGEPTDGPADGPRPHIAVAISGGGHRASLFGLGALLYLVDAGKGPELSTVSSISGGSITNGYVAMTSDLNTVAPADFWRDVKPLARRVATVGTLWASPLTYAFLATCGALIIAAIILTVVLDAAWAWLVWPVAALAVGWVAQHRSWVATKSFERGLFNGARLDSINAAVTHVICSSDLQTGEHVYFSGRFVNSYRTGWGTPADLKLARAVQASAALPGAFNVVTLPVGPYRFEKTPSFSSFKLTDGGVYDNMGTEWPIELGARLRNGAAPAGIALADELVVVNGSAGAGVVKRNSLRTPLLGELTTLLAVKDVLYNQTTSVRRRLLNLRFRITRRDPDAPFGRLAGTMVQIDRDPFDLPDEMARFSDALGDRARTAISRLGDDAAVRSAWREAATANRGVKTALSKIPADRAASLLRQSYAVTMVNCHVLLGYPLLDIPDDAVFRELVR